MTRLWYRGGDVREGREALLLGLLILLGATALLFGGAEPFAQMMFVAVAGILLITDVLLGGGSRPAAALKLPAFLYGGTLLVVILQLLPLPPGLIDTVSGSAQAWREAEAILSTELTARISINPGATRRALMVLLALGTVFWVALGAGADPARARRGLVGFVIVQVVIALYGLLVFATGNEQVFFLPKTAYGADLTASFVNKNSYATFAGLGLLTSLALTLDAMPRLPGDTKMRRKLVVTLETALRQPFLLSASAILATALLLSGSRAGLLCTAFAATALFFFATGIKRPRTAVGGALALVVVAGTLSLLLLDGTALGQRFLPAELADAVAKRLDIYSTSIRAVLASPAFGWGLGTYDHAVVPFTTDDLLSYRSLLHAHNTYIELAAGLGVPGAAALVAAVVLLVRRCWSGLQKRRRDRVFPMLACACSLLVGLHALVDFSLQILAVTAAYLLILGFGVAQSEPTRNRAEKSREGAKTAAFEESAIRPVGAPVRTVRA